ncbi:MAG: hypothetical protein AB7G75_06785 [Candidatus Binatia bacterium]
MAHRRKYRLAVNSQPQITNPTFFCAIARTALFFRLAPTLGLALCFLAACSQPKEVNLKEDLTKYLAQARQWTAPEAQINNAIIAVKQGQFVDDAQTLQTLKPILSVALAHVQQLENYQPDSQPLLNVHREYIEAWRAYYLAIAAIIDAVEKKDYIQLAKFKTELEQAQQSVAKALGNLARLLHTAGLRSEPISERPPADAPFPSSGSPSSP